MGYLQKMPEREEESQVREIPLDVQLHTTHSLADTGWLLWPSLLVQSAYMGKTGLRGTQGSHWDLSPTLFSEREGSCRKKKQLDC